MPASIYSFPKHSNEHAKIKIRILSIVLRYTVKIFYPFLSSTHNFILNLALGTLKPYLTVVESEFSFIKERNDHNQNFFDFTTFFYPLINVSAFFLSRCEPFNLSRL